MDWFLYDRDLRHERVKDSFSRDILYFSIFSVATLRLLEMQSFIKNFVKFIPPCNFTTGKQFAGRGRTHTPQCNIREY